MDAMADPRVFGDVDENDPKSVARWAKRMGQQMGDDLGDDWEEMVDEMMDEEMSGEGEGGEGSSKAPDDLGWG